MKKNPGATMSVLEHLSELRRRIIYSGLSVLLAVVFCFTQVGYLRYLLVRPADELKLVYFSPPEAFMANLRLAVIAGLALALPVIIYQALAFLFPGLHRHEKTILLVLIGCVLLLFYLGVFFAYMVVIPFVLHFFLKFETGVLSARFNISEYISFITALLAAFGVTFQLPLVLWVLGKIGMVSSDFLRKGRKYALLIMLLVSAIITPPDIISQVIMVVPLFFLYEAGIIAVVFSEKKRLKESLT